MAKNVYVSEMEDTMIDQLANTMAELVEQCDILLEEMKKIRHKDEELQEKEKVNSPKCDEFLGVKYQEFKSSKVINIEDIKEFISAKNELDSIKEQRLKLEEEARKINEERSVLTAQVEEAYEKIVELIKSSKENLNEKNGMYVNGLGRNVEIVDTYIREEREVVDASLTEIIRTTSKIYDALYQGYSENVTKIESEPVESYSETRTLIGSLNELIKIQNINIDSQIPLLNKPQEDIKKENKTVLTSNSVIEQREEKPVELVQVQQQLDSKPEVIKSNNSVINLNSIMKDEDIPKQVESSVNTQLNTNTEEVQNNDNIINLNSIINNNNVSYQNPSIGNNQSNGRIITINVPYSLDPSNKIANSNTKKYENIVNNFKKIATVIIIEKILKPELSTSSVKSDNSVMSTNVEQLPKSQESDNPQVLQQPIDPIANFLSGSKAA